MAGYMMGEYMAGIQGVFPAGLPAASKGFFPRAPKPFEARDVSCCFCRRLRRMTGYSVEQNQKQERND